MDTSRSCFPSPSPSLHLDSPAISGPKNTAAPPSPARLSTTPLFSHRQTGATNGEAPRWLRLAGLWEGKRRGRGVEVSRPATRVSPGNAGSGSPLCVVRDASAVW